MGYNIKSFNEKFNKCDKCNNDFPEIFYEEVLNRYGCYEFMAVGYICDECGNNKYSKHFK